MSDRNVSDDEIRDRTDDEVRDRDVDDAYDPNPQERGKWLSAVIALLGLWMIVQAVLFDLTAAQFWNDVIVGALLLAAGGYNYTRRANERLGNVAAATLAALLGLWLIASPFMFGADGGFAETMNEAGFLNDVVVGLIALALGAYSAYEIRDRRRDVAGTAR